MPNQEESPDGTPRPDKNRPTPDVERYATDGQTNARGKGPTSEQGQKPSPAASGQLNFDDFSEERPRGDTRRTGGSWAAPAHNTGDNGSVGPAPGAGLSNRNGPSDSGGRGTDR